MNDDELRRVLHAEADPVEVGDNSWPRLESRLHPVRRSAERSRAFAFGAAAITVVVLLVVGAMWLSRDDRDPSIGSSTRHPLPRGAPRRILAMTVDHQPVVLDAKTGKRTAQYESHSYAEGTQVAVAPNGDDFYFVDGDGNEGCEGHSILRLGLAGGRPGAAIADEASEPAISPDGRYLAYYRCLPGDERPDELVLRDLASGAERVTKAPATTGFGKRLAFEADSRHVVYQSISEQPVAGEPADRDRLYRLDLVGGQALPGTQVGIASNAWSGVLGDTGAYVGVFTNRVDPKSGQLGSVVMANRPLNPDDPSVFVARSLFFSARRPSYIMSDASGNNILAIVGSTLYRWSEGDSKPTRIRHGIIAAAWIPDAAAKRVPTPAAIVAVRSSSADVVLLDPGSGQSIKNLGSFPGVHSVAGTQDGTGLILAEGSPEACPSPRVDHLNLANGILTRIASGLPAVVNIRGLVAYGIWCDGRTLGFTDLATAEHSRSNPLADEPSESSSKVEGVEVLAWSPDGTRLVYRLRLRGDAEPHYYVGSLWPAVPSKRTKVIELPGGAKVTAATFIDNHRVLFAEAVGRRTALKVWRPDHRNDPALGVGTLPAGVTSLAADRSGFHILAIAEGTLLRWDRGSGGVSRRLADDVTAADWLATG